MGDALKISSEKRHRSSSSIAGVLEGVRSEKKIDVRASILEVDDQFTKAEARCDSLQEKIDLIKTHKRKKKLKKRSMTTITEPIPAVENLPVISIRTRPKKKMTQQTERFRRLEAPEVSKSRRGYIDPDLIEQHQMLGQVNARQVNRQTKSNKMRHNRRISSPGYNLSEEEQISRDMACGDDKSSDEEFCGEPNFNFIQANGNNVKRYQDSRPHIKHQTSSNKFKPIGKQNLPGTGSFTKEREQRQVVELFHKNRQDFEPPQQRVPMSKKNNNFPYGDKEQLSRPASSYTAKRLKKHNTRNSKRHYEQPTISSKIKQAGLRCYSGDASNGNIPFVVSKSTSPSHNVGVNLQQVLNGLKMKQPLPVKKIPPTIAHHMGLRHVPTSGSKSDTMQPRSDGSEMNVIKLGRRTLHLPSKRRMSYSRLLALYRADNNYVSRFLHAVERPHYFYTSMYDLSTNPEDADAATSKAQGNQAKRSLAEYASLYREYEAVEKALAENYDEKLEARKEQIAIRLAEREKHIRKLVGEYQPGAEEGAALHASASTAEETMRHSRIKL